MEPLRDWIDVAPWRSRKLLLINPTELTQAATLTEKREMLPKDRLLLIAAWPGQWPSSARYFGPQAAAAVATHFE